MPTRSPSLSSRAYNLVLQVSSGVIAIDWSLTGYHDYLHVYTEWLGSGGIDVPVSWFGSARRNGHAGTKNYKMC